MCREGVPGTPSTVCPKDQTQWPFLDWIRFIAALMVLFGHTRGLFFQSISLVENPGFFTRLFYLATGSHREGVALFFAISGFLVGGAVWRRMAEKRFDAKSYFISRFVRIYLVLLPSFILIAALAWVGSNYLADTRFYGERPLFPIMVHNDWTVGQMVCNLASMQSILCEHWGQNPPLWSLGFEWMFYLVAPIILGICFADAKRWVRGIGLIMVLVTLSLTVLMGHGSPLMPEADLDPGTVHWAPELYWAPWHHWLMIWFAGAFAARVIEWKNIPAWIGWGGIGISISFVILARLSIMPEPMSDAAIAFGLVLAISSRKVASCAILSALGKWGASFSFSLYIIHVPVSIFVGALLERSGLPSILLPPGPAAYTAFGVTCLTALLSARLFAALTEDHTGRVRKLFMAQK